MTADISDMICSFPCVVVVVVAVAVVAMTVFNDCYFVSVALLCTLSHESSECVSRVIIIFCQLFSL